MFLNTGGYRANGRLLHCVQAFTGLFRRDFFPSAGFRDRLSGALSNIGSNGYFSCSTTSESDVWRPRFVSDNASLGTAGGRAHAFSMRCVQALTDLFRGNFFPSAGYRDNGSGSPASVGSGAYFWTDSVSGTSAGYIYVNSSYAGMNSYTRSNGFPLRCVRAFAKSVKHCSGNGAWGE